MGEAEAYVLYNELQARVILTDDGELIKLCKLFEIPFVNALAIVVRMFDCGWLTREETCEYLRKLKRLQQIFRKGLQHIQGGSKMSMTISVRYEPKQDLDFITGVLGLTMSETVRSLIDEGRKMKALQLYRHGKVSL